MDKRRFQLIKQNKHREKYTRTKTDKYLTKVFIGSAIFGILNWLFWEVKFIETDSRYTLVFVILPLFLGLIYFYYTAKVFVAYFWNATTFLDKLLTRLFLVVMGLMLSFLSFGTVANMIFKVILITSTSNVESKVTSYEITRFIHNKSSRSNKFSRSSTIHFQYATDQNLNFSVDNYSLLNSKSHELRNKLIHMDEMQIKNKKLVLYTKEGFWKIKHIVDFELE